MIDEQDIYEGGRPSDPPEDPAEERWAWLEAVAVSLGLDEVES